MYLKHLVLLEVYSGKKGVHLFIVTYMHAEDGWLNLMLNLCIVDYFTASSHWVSEAIFWFVSLSEAMGTDRLTKFPLWDIAVVIV